MAIRPPLTATVRGGQGKPDRDEEMDVSWSNKEMETARRSNLTIIAPYKVFGCRPRRSVAGCAGGRRRKTSKGGNRAGGNVWSRRVRYGDLSAAGDLFEGPREVSARPATAMRLMSGGKAPRRTRHCVRGRDDNWISERAVLPPAGDQRCRRTNLRSSGLSGVTRCRS